MVRPTLGSRTTKEQSSSNFVRLRYRGICLNLCRDYNAFVDNLKYYRFDIIYIIIYVAEKSCRGIVLSGNVRGYRSYQRRTVSAARQLMPSSL